jgi:hypothetical protein
VAELPQESVEAVRKQRAWRERHSTDWTPDEELSLDLQAAAPAIRKQRDEELRERLLSPKTRGVFYDAHMRYRDVPQIEEAWAATILVAVAEAIFEETDDGR